MATTQKLLGEAVGIQFTGTRDETGTNPILGLTDGLIVGQFRRGRTDKPMRITQQNIRAELGYEPNNKFYQSVQAVLDQFPFVWVLRVGSIDNGNGNGEDGGGSGGGVIPPGGIRWRVQGDPTWYEWAGQNVEWGFKQNLNINELIVLDGVLSLGDQSFFNNQIASLVLPDSVQIIGQNAFSSNALTHLEIGSGVTLLRYYAFKDNQLESVTIHAVNPPDFSSLSYLPFDNNPLTAIYVPAQSVAAYKSNQYWSVYSELIYEI